MARELTKKQRGFIKDIIDTGNATKAAMNNYEIESKNKENVAGAIGSENLRKPKIRKVLKPFIDRLTAHRDKIQEAMDKKDLTKEQYRVLSEAMAKANHDIQLLGGRPTENYNLYDWGNYKDNNLHSENMDKAPARKPKEVESDSGS